MPECYSHDRAIIGRSMVRKAHMGRLQHNVSFEHTQQQSGHARDLWADAMRLFNYICTTAMRDAAPQGTVKDMAQYAWRQARRLFCALQGGATCVAAGASAATAGACSGKHSISPLATDRNTQAGAALCADLRTLLVVAQYQGFHITSQSQEHVIGAW